MVFSGGVCPLGDGMVEDVRNQIHFALNRCSRFPDVVQNSPNAVTLCRLSIRMKRLGSFSVDFNAEETLSRV